MLTFLLSTAAALIIGSADIQPTTVQRDTTDIYIINDEGVNDFDGSQLLGKTIAVYNIFRPSDSAIRVHRIKTIDALNTESSGKEVSTIKSGKSAATITITGSSSTSKVPAGNIIYVLNGKTIDEATFKNIKPTDIKLIDVVKNKEEIQKYSEDNNIDTLIKIYTE